MNFLLNPIGSLGEVQPYLAIGLTLLARGHHVTLITNPYHEPLVRKVGLDYVPLGDENDVMTLWNNKNMLKPARFWKSALYWSALSPMRQAYEIIAKRYIPGKTVVVAPPWAFGARIAHDKLGVPLATLHLSTEKLRSVFHSPAMPPPLLLSGWVPQPLKRIQLWIADRMFIDPVLSPEANLFRAELGLQPVRRFLFKWWNSPQLVIGMFPSWYCQPQPDWPPHTVLTGFPLWDQSSVTGPSEEISKYLEEGDPPVVFTFGTISKHTRKFFEASAECCRLLGCRGIFINKYREELPQELPEGVRHFTYVPLSYILHRSAALVHHAGTGTTAQGLAAGIPQLVVPTIVGQPDNAARLFRLGVGAMLKPRSFRGPAVAHALNRLLNSPQVAVRCSELSAKFENVNPIQHTCDLLEEISDMDKQPASLSTGIY
jgi:UDP:flavonoid glycosyltransferase YjiC (YdhE family)